MGEVKQLKAEWPEGTYTHQYWNGFWILGIQRIEKELKAEF